jgi:hypothetical protein
MPNLFGGKWRALSSIDRGMIKDAAMRFYLILSLVIASLIGGYHLTETYRQLDDFHRRYLEGGPLASSHAAHSTQNVTR